VGCLRGLSLIARAFEYSELRMHFEHSGPPVTANDVERVERLVGCRLPAPYREFLLRHNGGTPRPSGFAVDYGFGLDIECVEVFHSIGDGTGANDLEAAIRSDLDPRQDHEQFAIPADGIWIGAAGAGEIVLFVKGLRAGQAWLKARGEDRNNPMEGMSFLASAFDEFLGRLTPCEWDASGSPG
jgi:hypothetical protein